MWRFTQGVASLALGYGGHWAFSPPGVDFLAPTPEEVIGFSALLVTFVTPQSCLRLNYLFVVKAG